MSEPRTADVVVIGGGNTANMLAIWRVHGVDVILREAWEAGIVLCGVSAGAICWFEDSVTDSYTFDLGPLHDGLGFLPGSFCPHYDGEPRRRPVYQDLLTRQVLPNGYAADDCVAVTFRDQEFHEAVTMSATAKARRVQHDSENGVNETAIETRLLS